MGDVMDVSVMEPVASEKTRSYLPLLEALFAVLARRSPRVGKLHLEAMPDRVKRDLGFLDGREPRYEDERMR
jgi:hypothetical protein